jgi:hypothetical protein
MALGLSPEEVAATDSAVENSPMARRRKRPPAEDVPPLPLPNGTPPGVTRDENGLVLHAIGQQLARLEQHLREIETKLRATLAAVHPEWVQSARNLVHYTALRQHDLRELQLLLQQRGLSSLGRSESFVMASLLEVQMRVGEALMARGAEPPLDPRDVVVRRAGALSAQTAEFLLHGHTHDALGPKPEGRHVYAMVTAPAASKRTYWLARMLRAGMNVLRSTRRTRAGGGRRSSRRSRRRARHGPECRG